MKKGLQKMKQWAKDNKEELVVCGFIVSTSVVVGSIVYGLSKGEVSDELDKLDVVEDAIEELPEVKIYLGGLNDTKDAGGWLVNMVEEFTDADGNAIQYSMDKIAEDILEGNYKEI